MYVYMHMGVFVHVQCTYEMKGTKVLTLGAVTHGLPTYACASSCVYTYMRVHKKNACDTDTQLASYPHGEHTG